MRPDERSADCTHPNLPSNPSLGPPLSNPPPDPPGLGYIVFESAVSPSVWESNKAMLFCFAPDSASETGFGTSAQRSGFQHQLLSEHRKVWGLGSYPGGRWRRFRVRSEVGLVRGRRSAVMVPETETLEEELVWEKMLSLVLGVCGCPVGVQVWDLGLEKGLSRMHQTEMGAPRGRGSDHCRAQLQSLRGALRTLWVPRPP